MIAKESSISNKDKIILISLFYFMIFQNVLENYFNIFDCNCYLCDFRFFLKNSARIIT